MNDPLIFRSPVELDLIKSTVRSVNAGLYILPVFLCLIVLFSVIFIFTNFRDRYHKKSENKFPKLILTRVEDFFRRYIDIFRRILFHQWSKTEKLLVYPFIGMILCNLFLLFLVPFSHRFQGIHTEFGILIFISILFINLLIFMSLLYGKNGDSYFSIIAHGRLQLSIYIILSISILSIGIHTGSFDINTVILNQSVSYFFTLPKWNIIAGFGSFINAVVFFLYSLLLIQQFRQDDRPIPYNYSKLWDIRKRPNVFLLVEYWRYSLLALISAIFVSIFLGGYLSPFFQISSGAVPVHGFFWLMLKLGIFWILIVTIYRSIPHLVEEQILTLSYKYVIPIQLIAFGLKRLYEYIL